MVSRCILPLALLVAFAVTRPAAAQKAPPAESKAGEALYARYCKLCHAADGRGYAADEAPSLVSPTFLASASDDYLARGIRFGRPNTAMAAYGESRGGPLSDAEVASIVAFLRSKGPRHTALPEVPVRGNPRRGEALYVRECRSCHGSASQPGKAPQLHNAEFLSAATPAFLRHAIVHGRPPTPMPAFAGRLGPAEIEDVVAWLDSLRPRAAPQRRPVPGVRGDLPVVIHPDGKPPSFSLREGRFVSAEQVARALAEKRRLIIIDARSPSDWIQFHIPGALPIPYYDTAKLDSIPRDGTWVIAYCACPHHASGEVVDALRRRGHTRAVVLDEGILYWRRQGLPLAGEAVPASPAPARR